MKPLSHSTWPTIGGPVRTLSGLRNDPGNPLRPLRESARFALFRRPRRTGKGPGPTRSHFASYLRSVRSPGGPSGSRPGSGNRQKCRFRPESPRPEVRLTADVRRPPKGQADLFPLPKVPPHPRLVRTGRPELSRARQEPPRVMLRAHRTSAFPRAVTATKGLTKFRQPSKRHRGPGFTFPEPGTAAGRPSGPRNGLAGVKTAISRLESSGSRADRDEPAEGPARLRTAAEGSSDLSEVCQRVRSFGTARVAREIKPRRVASYRDDNTRSRPITEVKHRRAGIVLGWGTAWELPVGHFSSLPARKSEVRAGAGELTRRESSPNGQIGPIAERPCRISQPSPRLISVGKSSPTLGEPSCRV